MLTNPDCHFNTCIAAIRYDQQAIFSYLIHITCRENSYTRKTEGLLPLRLKDATIVREREGGIYQALRGGYRNISCQGTTQRGNNCFSDIFRLFLHSGWYDLRTGWFYSIEAVVTMARISCPGRRKWIFTFSFIRGKEGKPEEECAVSSPFEIDNTGLLNLILFFPKNSDGIYCKGYGVNEGGEGGRPHPSPLV